MSKNLDQDPLPEVSALLSTLIVGDTTPRVAPGFALGIWSEHHPGTPLFEVTGVTRIAESSPLSAPVTVDTFYDLASLTKVMVTTSLISVLVDRGSLAWDTPVHSILPQVPPGILVRHLLSHTSGYAAWKPFFEDIRAAFPGDLWKVSFGDRQRKMREQVLATVPESAPGEKGVYSDIGFLILGFLIEEILGRPLDEAAFSLIFEPMHLEGLHFSRISRSPDQADPRYAATENCPWRKSVLQGQVHDDNAWAMGGVAGHAGLFGTIKDVVNFGAQFLSTAVGHEALWTRVSAPPGWSRTLGWDTPASEGSSIGSMFSRHCVGHFGFTGTSLWIDRRNRVVVALLSNRVHPAREPNLLKDARAKIHEAIGRDLKSLGWIE